jgi:hypothetical protein
MRVGGEASDPAWRHQGMGYRHLTFSEYPVSASFLLLALAIVVVAAIFCPGSPYHREGERFVDKMGRPATEAQYHLDHYLVPTYFTAWTCMVLSLAYEMAKRRDQKTDGSPRDTGKPCRVNCGWSRSRGHDAEWAGRE